MPDFLLEIGTEELPAGYISRQQLDTFSDTFSQLLTKETLEYQSIKATATPRRIVFCVAGLPAQTPAVTREITGPRVSAAYDQNNQPTPALLGFAKRYQLAPSKIQSKETPKGKVCVARVTTKGEKTELILSRLIEPFIKKMAFPKSMWWSTKNLSFARPIRYLMAVLGQKHLKVKLDRVTTGNKTRGHPWLTNHKNIPVTSAKWSEYKTKLKKAYVLVDEEERKRQITDEINKLQKKYGWQINEPILLNEVANLVEYPTVMICDFDKKYLVLPEPVLASAMKNHQRYFPVRDRRGILLSKFIVVTNNTPNRNKLIREGNERVLRARLADALFFWEQDKKHPLVTKQEKLKDIAFLGTLGSFAEKTDRLKNLSRFIAEESKITDDGITKDTVRAAELCKTDLLTEMVGEFPDLQGVMGYEYSRQQREPKNVAEAIKEHYLPRFAGDVLPKSLPGIFLSLAEKFDNLAACFVLNLEPTGSQDPYALRRQTLGIIRIIQTKVLINLSLNKITDFALAQIFDTINNLADRKKITLKKPEEYRQRIISFLQDRLSRFYLENSYKIDLIRATLKTSFDRIPQCTNRLNMLRDFSRQPIWPQLVTVVERTYKIGKKVSVAGEVKPDLLKEPEEKKVWETYQQNKDQIQQLINEQKYHEASDLYARVFTDPVHTFFEKVFVNVEDQSLRDNRILLMSQINKLYSSQIADLSQISVDK